MAENPGIYNSRVIKNYFEYLKIRYSEISFDEIFKYADMTVLEVEDPGHWFSQRQIDRFYEILVKKTGNPKISREVGRYLTSSQGLGPVKQYMLGQINPMSVYLLMGKVYGMVSRGATVQTKKLGPSSVEITSKPKPGVDEKPHQCENRLGSFESLATLFTKGFASIEHPTCYHRGDDLCRYIISWERTSSILWKRVRNGMLLLSLLTLTTLYFLLPSMLWEYALFSAAFANLLLVTFSQLVEKKELTKTIETQGNAAEDLLEEMDIRYNNAVLIQEIGQATSATLNVDTLLQKVMAVIQNRLDIDRGMIMLANDSKTRLNFIVGFGYEHDQFELLNNTLFSLDKPESKGTFVVAFREQKPIMVNDLSEIKDDLSEKSFHFARQLGVKSLICVPLVYENESLGILAVDKVKSKRPATKSDMSLLLGVASQIAVGITNAQSFQKLQESEKKYRDLVESANSIILRQDIQGRITFFNAFAQRMFGYAEKDLIGRNIIGTIFSDSEKACQNLQNLVTALKEDPERRLIREARHVLKSGEKVWIAWTYKPILEKNGELGEILCIGNDITELKQAEGEKKELELRLQRAQKMEAVGTLAGGVAHDLNNILSGIVSYPELILMGLQEDNPLRKPVETMKKSGEKAAAIVQDLLTLARRGVVSKKIVNLNTIVSEYLNSPEFENLKSHFQGMEVKTRLGKNLMNMLGSQVHLSKTLMNLVSNALEAIPESGKVLISTCNRYIDKPIRGYDEVKKGDYVTLTVVDTGIGIPPADIDRIFEPFFTKKVMGRSGTGLGMAVVWGAVKDHDGYIDIDSIVGKGTRFTLYFPVSREKVERENERLNIQSLMGRGESILVVDDAADQREIAGDILRKLEYSVASVASGEEAVEYVRHHPVNLLVLDMIMDPGMDGFETYKKIVEIHPGQKAIIVSGFSETKRVKDAQKLGAGVYVRKPYLIDRIGQAVKKTLHSNSSAGDGHIDAKVA